MRKPALARKPAAALVACAAVAALAIPASASAAGSGGVGPTSAPPPPAPGSKAKLTSTGQARPPADAPQEVKDAIAAANSIDDAGYCTGGGHGKGNCYDCSGAVSYVLGPHGAGILKSPLDSGSLERWGERGRGSWITVYTNSGHAMVVIAGLRFDTSQPDDGQEGPGWSKNVKEGMVNGPFVKRHWLGL
jgi:cell wall-associated NlpC family hydrolase